MQAEPYVRFTTLLILSYIVDGRSDLLKNYFAKIAHSPIFVSFLA